MAFEVLIFNWWYCCFSPEFEVHISKVYPLLLIWAINIQQVASHLLLNCECQREKDPAVLFYQPTRLLKVRAWAWALMDVALCKGGEPLHLWLLDPCYCPWTSALDCCYQTQCSYCWPYESSHVDPAWNQNWVWDPCVRPPDFKYGL